MNLTPQNAQARPKAGLTTFTRVVVLIAVYFLGGLLGKQARLAETLMGLGHKKRLRDNYKRREK